LEWMNLCRRQPLKNLPWRQSRAPRRLTLNSFTVLVAATTTTTTIRTTIECEREVNEQGEILVVRAVIVEVMCLLFCTETSCRILQRKIVRSRDLCSPTPFFSHLSFGTPLVVALVVAVAVKKETDTMYVDPFVCWLAISCMYCAGECSGWLHHVKRNVVFLLHHKRHPSSTTLVEDQ
jgi:hypothetical protein